MLSLSLFFFVLFFCFANLINCSHISPYKHTAFDISVPYANHSNLEIKSIFIISENPIPSSVYFIIAIESIDYFKNKDVGTLLDCRLEDYEELDGANFNSGKDLILNSSEKTSVNYISLCGATPPIDSSDYIYFYFKLNQTLEINIPYQLSFRMTASFSYEGKGFLSFIVVYFQSTLLSKTPYIYASNEIFASYGVNDPLLTYAGMNLSRHRNYYEQNFFDIINKVLDESLLSYSVAKLKLIDIGVSTFNQMIKTLTLLDLVVWDYKPYPEGIEEYPGFLGNLMLEILVDRNLKAFTLFELVIPQGWTFENSHCISLNFTKDNQTFNSIPHTICKKGSDSQTLDFYNIQMVPKNTFVRFNITKVRSPSIPISGMAKIMVYHEPSKKIQLESTELGLLKVVKTNNLKISMTNAISERLTNGSPFFLNKTQQFNLEITLEYYDILSESKIVITQNSSETKFGFKNGTCVVINKDNALLKFDLKPIDCVIDKTSQTLTINNIASIYSDKSFNIYFLNDNEELIETNQFKIDIYVKNLDGVNFSNTSSISNSQNLILQKESLTISNVYYEFENSTKVLDSLEIAKNQASFKIEFSMPQINYNSEKTDYLEIIMNSWIYVDLNSLMCSVKLVDSSKNLNCIFSKQNNIGILLLLLDGINLFTNTTFTLEIQGLSYERIVFNAYKYVFEYNLVYFSINSIYASCFSANMVPSVNENPENSLILIIGQGGSATVDTSLLKIKLSSPNYSYYSKLSLWNSKVRIYFKNLKEENTDFSNFTCYYPPDSNIHAYYVKGTDNKSETFLDWNRFEISNISSSDLESFISIPVTPNQLENPIIYVAYSLGSSSSSSTPDNFDLVYDLVKKESNASERVLSATKLEIDWNVTKESNEENLIVRSKRIFIFSISISLDIYKSFYVNENAGYFIFFLPWNNPEDDATITCEFVENIFSDIKVFVINDDVSKKSMILMLPDMTQLESNTDNGFEDMIRCNEMTIPANIASPNYQAYITNNEGVLLTKNVVNSGVFNFTAASLTLERLLVTPNNIEFPAAHYAFYFKNEIKILKSDGVGTYLPSTFGNMSTTNYICYISLLPSTFEIPTSGECFNFDGIDYQLEASKSFDPETDSIIRLASSDCEAMADVNDPESLYIYLFLDLENDLPADSFLLFEVFGIKNPTTTLIKISIFILRMTPSFEFEEIMASSRNFVHILYDFIYQIDGNIEILPEITPFHVEGLYHMPLVFEVTLNDFILPNFVITLKFSDNINESNQDNVDLKVFAQVENLETDIYYLDVVAYNYLDEDYEDDDTTSSNSRLLQDENSTDTSTNDTSTDNTSTNDTDDTNTDDTNTDDTSTDNTSTNDTSINDTSTNDTNTDDTNTDDTSTDDASADDEESTDETVDTENTLAAKTYRKPIVQDFFSGYDVVNLTIGQPSLSQRKIKVGFYLFLLPEANHEIEVNMIVSVREDILISLTETFTYLEAFKGNLTAVSKNEDISLETQSSNFSTKITADFEIKAEVKFLTIGFSEPFIVPPELLLWIDGNLMSNYYQDKYIVGTLPEIKANTPFTLDIVNFMFPPSSQNKICYVTVYLCNEGETPIIAQSLIYLNPSQKMESSTILGLIQTSSIFNTFASFSLEIDFESYDTEFQINEILRLVLPTDFPPNYYFNENLIKCSLLLESSNKVIGDSCKMKGKYVDVTINGNMDLSDYSEVKYVLNISNIYSSAYYGNCGDFGLILFNSSKQVIAKNFRFLDYYANPIILQKLARILKTIDISATKDLSKISIIRGTKEIIYLKTEEQNFKNEMKISLSIYGNTAVTISNQSLNISYGDFYVSFILSVSPSAFQAISFVRISKTEKGVNKYEEFYPLEVSVSYDKIVIEVEKKIVLYAGGESYYLLAYPTSTLNINVTIIAESSNINLTIIDSNSSIFNETNSFSRFKIALKNNSLNSSTYKITYSLAGIYSKWFSLSSPETIITVAQNPKNLNSTTLTFTGSLNIKTRSMDLIIKDLKFPTYIFYQAYEEISNGTLELNATELFAKFEKTLEIQIVEENMTSGILFCLDISENCIGRLEALNLKKYYLNAFALSPSGISSIKPYKTSFEPYPIKPLVINMGFSQDLTTNTEYNDILCCLIDFFTVNYNDLILADKNLVCNITMFNTAHSRRVLESVSSQSTASIEQSKEYIQTISSTLLEMGVKTQKLHNLDSTVISKMVGNYASLRDFVRESTQSSLKFFLYPPITSPNINLSIYSEMITGETKMAYFKSKYSFLDYSLYLKNAGVIGADGDVQKIIPIFVGKPIIRTDSMSVSLTLELSNEAMVYAVIVNSENAKKPNGTQITYGVDGGGKIVVGFTSQKSTFDSEENFKPLTLKFSNLTNNVNYTIFYVAGLPVPRDPLVSQNVYNATAIPQDPLLAENNTRILVADGDDI